MNWIKNVVLDIIILVIIAIYAITEHNIIEMILWGYTGLLLVSKTLYLFVDFFKIKKVNNAVPDIFYHVIYFLSISLLYLATNYYLAVAWFVIWIISVITILKNKQSDP